MQASRAVVWLLENFHCRKTGGEPDGCVNPTREHVTAGAGSASLSATSPVGTLVAAAGVSSARFFLGGRFPRRHSWTRLSVLFAELLHVAASLTERRLRCAPTPSLRPRSPPSSTPPEVCPQTMESDVRRRRGTTTTHAPHSSPTVAWDRTSTRCQVGRSWRLRLHERRLTW